MKSEELDQIKNNLLKYKEDLENELELVANKSADGYQPKFPNYGREEDDNILEIENYSENIEIEEQLNELLTQTKKALAKIDDGSYGFCKNCQKMINPERLKAYPIASTCLNCSGE